MTSQSKATSNIDQPGFWDMCYQQGRTPWDYGRVTPPLETFMQSPYKMSAGRVGVLGCGTGYDAVYLAQCGYETVGIDFSQFAVNSTNQKFVQAGVSGKTGFLLHKDFFDMHEYRDYFDHLYEHTTFCSLDPVHRNRYRIAVGSMLKKGGKLLAIWWIGERKSQGLPFAVTKDEIFELFDGSFSFDIVYEPHDSFGHDRGRELLTLMTKL